MKKENKTKKWIGFVAKEQYYKNKFNMVTLKIPI